MDNFTSRKLIAPLAFVFFSLGLCAQDIHYSQTGNSPLNLNPGLTGVFGGNHRFAANFRRQWSSIPVPYLQLSGAYDIRFVDDKERFKPWSSGLLFNYDQAGDAKLSFSQLGLSGSYSHRLFPGKRNFLTFGIMVSGMQRAFKPGGLQFDDQYTLKEGYVNTIPTSEVFDENTKFMGDISGGINLRLQDTSARAVVDIGLGVFHFTEPKKNFMQQELARLEQRYSIYAIGTFNVVGNFDLLFTATAQFQGGYQEALLGVGGLYHLSSKKTQELALQLGLNYRAADAVIPYAGIQYQAWQLVLSYDLNTSPLREASLRRGGPELSLVYILRHVQPAQYCKSCPTYM